LVIYVKLINYYEIKSEKIILFYRQK